LAYWVLEETIKEYQLQNFKVKSMKVDLKINQITTIVLGDLTKHIWHVHEKISYPKRKL